MAHPPRSNPPLRSSSGAPSPCITPSTETCVVVVSFMIVVPFLLGSVPFGAPLVGGRSPLLRTPLPRSDTASRISFEVPVGAHHRGDLGRRRVRSDGPSRPDRVPSAVAVTLPRRRAVTGPSDAAPRPTGVVCFGGGRHERR